MDIAAGFEAQVRPRSGLALKYGVTVLNSPGTIDSDYRGEVGVILINHGEKDFPDLARRSNRSACRAPAPQARLTLVEDVATSVRGAGGFGSTGAKICSDQTN